MRLADELCNICLHLQGLHETIGMPYLKGYVRLAKEPKNEFDTDRNTSTKEGMDLWPEGVCKINRIQ